MAKVKNKIEVNKEKNRLLEITTVSIPYIKELKNLPLVKSTNACILMQQIEYWMVKYPEGFYKFLSRPSSIQYAYKEGDSWMEELGISEAEYRTAFDQIGVRYNSKKAYDQAKEIDNEFRNKYYCSYFNKVTRLTHYFRNNEKVEEAIDFIDELQNLLSRNGNSNVTESTILTPRDKDSEFIEVNIIDSESTEITTKNTPDNNLERVLSTDNEDSLLINNFDKQENGNYKSGDVMESVLSSYNGNESFNHNGAGDCLSEKIIIPLDFTPTWDEKYRAIRTFDNKSPAYITQKLVDYYHEKGTKKTIPNGIKNGGIG